MSLIFSTLVAGELLLHQGIVEKDRVEVLKPYFDPAPGSSVEISYDEVKNNEHIPPINLRGYIKVTPPKGRCFTITPHYTRKDVKVCDEQKLYFELRDLDPKGNISWIVKVDDMILETKLEWPTPHRPIKYIPHGLDYGTKVIYLHHCEYFTKFRPNRVEMKTFDGLHWVFKIPQKKVELEVEETKQNLYIGSQETQKKRHRALDFSTGTVESWKRKQEIPWETTSKGTYLAEPNNFTSNFQSPVGSLKGECRFRFENPNNPNEFGVLECHKTSEFEFVIVPLPCLKPQD